MGGAGVDDVLDGHVKEVGNVRGEHDARAVPGEHAVLLGEQRAMRGGSTS